MNKKNLISECNINLVYQIELVLCSYNLPFDYICYNLEAALSSHISNRTKIYIDILAKFRFMICICTILIDFPFIFRIKLLNFIVYLRPGYCALAASI